VVDPSQTPKTSNTICPCSGCTKSRKQVIDKIVKHYESCNFVELQNYRLYCKVWYSHPHCEYVRELLYAITSHQKYAVYHKEIK
jgi:hypothetical protein